MDPNAFKHTVIRALGLCCSSVLLARPAWTGQWGLADHAAHKQVPVELQKLPHLDLDSSSPVRSYLCVDLMQNLGCCVLGFKGVTEWIYGHKPDLRTLPVYQRSLAEPSFYPGCRLPTPLLRLFLPLPFSPLRHPIHCTLFFFHLLVVMAAARLQKRPGRGIDSRPTESSVVASSTH